MRKTFFKIHQILPLMGPQYMPAPWFLQTWIPIPQRCFLPNLVEIST